MTSDAIAGFVTSPGSVAVKSSKETVTGRVLVLPVSSRDRNPTGPAVIRALDSAVRCQMGGSGLLADQSLTRSRVPTTCARIRIRPPAVCVRPDTITAGVRSASTPPMRLTIRAWMVCEVVSRAWAINRLSRSWYRSITAAIWAAPAASLSVDTVTVTSAFTVGGPA